MPSQCINKCLVFTNLAEFVMPRPHHDGAIMKKVLYYGACVVFL